MKEFFAENLQLVIFLALIILTIAGYYIFSMSRFLKQRESFLKFQNNLKADDEVVLSSGIHGKIVSLDDKTAVIEISPNTKITVNRFSINAKKA